MNTAAKKQKGRSLVLEVKEWLHKIFPEFKDDDIIIPATSQPGEDIKLSPALRKLFPFSIECKRQEGLGKVYSFMEQAQSNAGTNTPIVIMRSNHKEALVVISLKDFEKLL
jgi:hypothetical protein